MPEPAPAVPSPDRGPRRDRPRILVLCSGNICRSPMGEVLLRRRLAEAGLPGVVRSAGRFFDGRSAERYAIDAMARRGLDLEPFRSRILGEPMLAGADLVLGMAREHVREATVLRPDAFARTFTLKELVRRATEEGVRSGEHFPAFIARLAADRPMAAHLGTSHEDDIEDPMGGPPHEFEATAAEIDEQLERLVALLAPTLPVLVPSGAAPAPAAPTPPRG
jgi:protein-tyrosine phosphatase